MSKAHRGPQVWTVGQRIVRTRLDERKKAQPSHWVIKDFNPSNGKTELWWLRGDDDHCGEIEYHDLRKPRDQLDFEWEFEKRPIRGLVDSLRRNQSREPDTKEILAWKAPAYATRVGTLLMARAETDNNWYMVKVCGFDPRSRRTYVSYGDGSEWCWATSDKLKRPGQDINETGVADNILGAKMRKVAAPPFDPEIYGLPARFAEQIRARQTNHTRDKPLIGPRNQTYPRKGRHVSKDWNKEKPHVERHTCSGVRQRKRKLEKCSAQRKESDDDSEEHVISPPKKKHARKAASRFLSPSSLSTSSPPAHPGFRLNRDGDTLLPRNNVSMKHRASRKDARSEQSPDGVFKTSDKRRNKEYKEHKEQGKDKETTKQKKRKPRKKKGPPMSGEVSQPRAVSAEKLNGQKRAVLASRRRSAHDEKERKTQAHSGNRRGRAGQERHREREEGRLAATPLRRPTASAVAPAISWQNFQQEFQRHEDRERLPPAARALEQKYGTVLGICGGRAVVHPDDEMKAHSVVHRGTAANPVSVSVSLSASSSAPPPAGLPLPPAADEPPEPPDDAAPVVAEAGSSIPVPFQVSQVSQFSQPAAPRPEVVERLPTPEVQLAVRDKAPAQVVGKKKSPPAQLRKPVEFVLEDAPPKYSGEWARSLGLRMPVLESPMPPPPLPKFPPLPKALAARVLRPRHAVVAGRKWYRMYDPKARQYFWCSETGDGEPGTLGGDETESQLGRMAEKRFDRSWDPWADAGEEAPFHFATKGWVRLLDSSSKRFYYWHYPKGEPTLEKPDGYVALPEEEPVWESENEKVEERARNVEDGKVTPVSARDRSGQLIEAVATGRATNIVVT